MIFTNLYGRSTLSNGKLGKKTTKLRYTNPFAYSRRNLDNSILWIYLTSSNYLPWINTFSRDIPSAQISRNHNSNSLDVFYFSTVVLLSQIVPTEGEVLFLMG
ncbi:hypothetical protein RhiirA4_462503 [Rhizophagus irregularis]|uniref:Uncharacterized protein n=1 Tax=Rhizophagus irregularis TaxID=588596 RepID=A0A2I1GL31_9GLOM|nr:hypothetical protein RhiirA4_462503 [Rhizophagus irregularis]